MFGISGINCGAGCADFAAEHVCKLEKHVETFFAPHSVATGHDDRRAFDVDFRLGDMAVDNLHHIVFRGDEEIGVERHNFTFVSGVEYLFLHYAFAHCGHLRTAFGV